MHVLQSSDKGETSYYSEHNTGVTLWLLRAPDVGAIRWVAHAPSQRKWELCVLGVFARDMKSVTYIYWTLELLPSDLIAVRL